MPYYFYKVSFFLYISIIFCKYTLHGSYVFNVIWRVLFMTDGLIVVWSNDRAAPTDINLKNLELASPQSVTATRLDQIVYSPNCYIPIFRQLFSRSGDRTRNRSRSNALPIVMLNYFYISLAIK